MYRIMSNSQLRFLSSIRKMSSNMASTPITQRKFAPLNSAAAQDVSVPTLKGVVFDVDGTLW